jgi:hypothetical protein
LYYGYATASSEAFINKVSAPAAEAGCVARAWAARPI